MEQLQIEFIETLRYLALQKPNLLTNNLYTWEVYGLYFEQHGSLCPVCHNPEAKWFAIYQHKETKQQCSVCHMCSSKIRDNNISEMVKYYINLKDSLYLLISKPVLDYCYKAGVIDTNGYDAYLNIIAYNRTIVITKNQYKLIKSINYQFVKLIRERMPNKDKSTWAEEFMYVSH